MRLNQLRFFVGVVEAGSVRAAARKLGVSPAAITKGLQQFEQELRVRLLERTQHGAVPTAAGRAFVARARAVQSELRQAEEELAQLTRGHTGSVAFGAGPTTMTLVVPQALAEFRELYVDARVRIFEGLSPAMLPLVRDGTLDFALVLRPEEKLEAGLRFRPLFQDELVIAARKAHPLRNEGSLARLADAHWVTWPHASPALLESSSTAGPAWATTALGRAFSSAALPAPRSMTQCDSFNSVIALLAQTDVVAPMPRRLLASPVSRDVLQQIPIRERLPSATHGILTRANAPLTRVADAMAKALIAAARKLARRTATE